MFSTTKYAIFLLLALGMFQARASEVQKAADFVNIDAEYMTKYLTWDKREDLERIRQFTLAVSAMNYVLHHVSSIRYGYQANVDRNKLPKSDEEALATGMGICGNQVSVFLSIMTRLGLTARSLEFYWADAKGVQHSHIAAEVMLDNKWRFFDVTWGAYFSSKTNRDFHNYTSLYDILSFEESKKLMNRTEHAIINAAALPYRLQLINDMNPFEYFDRVDTLLIGKTGNIRLQRGEHAGNLWRFKPEGLPNILGVTADYATGNLGTVEVSISAPAPISRVHIDEIGHGCKGNNSLVVSVNGKKSAMEIRSEKNDFELNLPPPVRSDDLITFSILPESNAASCVLVYESISLY